MRTHLNAVYRERTFVVAALAFVAASQGCAVWLAPHIDQPGETWEDDWRTVLYIQLPTGQVSWHLHDSEVALFAWVKDAHLFRSFPYDGHSTDEKYRRIYEYVTGRKQ